ncbi:MAG: PSD1 and planctomycete cytochrome C domain-containing protein [Verrucomicrobia bacterium]|nr:PSD1 and planctomycete cytochrome C domain-containing protein [Verrucomicrobiota bacterium]
MSPRLNPGWIALLALAAPFLHAADMPAGHPPVAPAIKPADAAFFESKIRPILIDRCYKCHSKEGDKVKGGLLLDSREAVLAGGNTGPALVPGKPDESLLIQAVRYKDEDLQMPPKGEKLTDQQIADLTEWVRRGAPDPRTTLSKGSSAAYAGVGKNHWSFQPVKKPEVPAVGNQAWVKNPVDNFVLAKLEANGMAPNTPAEKTTLIRRLYFDLIGLPPHPADVQAFVNDPSPDAYSKIVDKLLASPAYGEHWARYWLDVARYSDTKGDAPKQEDNRYPFAWTYRDFVIDAFNADLPYDKFILAQLAGDYLSAYLEKQAKLKPTPTLARNAAMGKPAASADPAVELPKVEVTADRPDTRWPLAALGFLSLGNQFNGRKDDIIGDQIDVTSKAFLGLTVACARCHDHKFDPIPTKDYYSLYGIFANTLSPTDLPILAAKTPATADYLDYLEKSKALDKREADLKAEQLELRRATGGKAKGAMAKVDPQKRQQLQKAERELYRDKTDLELNHPGAPVRACAVTDVPRSRDYPVLLRGEVSNKGDVVPRRFLEILSPDPKKRPVWDQGSGRLQLAQAIADPKNPLTARVLVNRLWQQHWGKGFVETPDDLGNMSSPPTHPELLDWLAATFVENNWSIKSIQRLIVLSAAYQQSSAPNPKYVETDPNNKFLWRYNLRRMDFEELHDSLLAITGELDRTRGGKPVAIGSDGFAKRRSIYTMIDRTNPPELLTQFDFPSPDVSSGRRYETLVPQQALFLMNSQMVIETARKLVDRPAFAELKSDDLRVTSLYLAIFQRWPTKKEVEIGLKYVKSNPQGTDVVLSAELPAEKVNARDARIAERKAKATKQKNNKFVQQVGGIYDTQPLDAWTKLAHALFQTNEASFYN